ncbi:Crp/Fnr family transcriptional regulator [Hydrogenophaga sp. YM1]|uniref:Crp/Fnr family transcriptional regulator n=1 Tax=Hydrogenophaga TaxID=47420 RepID=UPI0009F526FD|nr:MULTISPECIES: Crp/Fnr family transcriptional regulator [unclassified Hydrogenophaga]MBN9370964.1 Crp/Fnr family transcriptional regulator [Hydrogenophaga sp.]QRR36318.1 Crp/Fnr family transcriptional regulator [Hydrogenophaga sp. YM1]
MKLDSPAMSERRQETWGLSPEDVELWLRHDYLADRLRIRKGNLLYGQGEVSPHFFLILSGEVRISCFEEDGQEITIEVMGPNGLCGDAPAFDGLPRFSTAVALRDAEVLRFDARRLREAFASHPELALSLLRIVSIKQRVLAIRLEYAFSLPPEARVLHLLRRVAGIFGTTTAQGREMTVHLTHEQVGRMTGTSRVTVTRVINRLRQRGQLAMNGSRFVVLNEGDPPGEGWPETRAEASNTR